MFGCLTHGRDLRVGQRIAIDLTGVPSLARNMSMRIKHQCAYRHITVLCGAMRQFQRTTHRLIIVHTASLPGHSIAEPPPSRPWRSNSPHGIRQTAH